MKNRDYRESYGAAHDELVEKDVHNLIESGYVAHSGSDFESTPAGNGLDTKMTTVESVHGNVLLNSPRRRVLHIRTAWRR